MACSGQAQALIEAGEALHSGLLPSKKLSLEILQRLGRCSEWSAWGGGVQDVPLN